MIHTKICGRILEVPEEIHSRERLFNMSSSFEKLRTSDQSSNVLRALQEASVDCLKRLPREMQQASLKLGCRTKKAALRYW